MSQFLRRRQSVIRLTLATCVIAALAIWSLAGARDSAPGDVSIAVTQEESDAIRVVYELAKPRREIIFGELASGHRERRWRPVNDGFKILRLDTEDRLVRKDGKKFRSVEVIAQPDLIRLPKEYQPLARYGEDGLLFYTGHFWPMTGRGGRVNATFDFAPAEGNAVIAFGERTQTLIQWRSPMAHPAFVYLGPLDAIETDHVMALIDPKAPDWIQSEFAALTPAVFAELTRLFGFSLPSKPNLFLAAPLGRDAGRLSYAGDALPGQFQITLEGAAWREPTAKARRIFRRSTAHEAVHLWQAVARPSVESFAAWVHEGAADAIAAEILIGLSIWDETDARVDLDRAKTECKKGLKNGSLASAEERGDYRAIYTCGHLIAETVAQTEEQPVSAFWREFIDLAQNRNGYTEALFYELVERRTGDDRLPRAIQRFVGTDHPDPAAAIDRLLAASGSSAADLRVGEGVDRP
ncbi:MAG: hypothetical protein AAGB02_05190 [Pseudomonadota bacterium]